MAQQIFSCEIVNRELENGFSSEHSLQVNGFSPEWVLGGFWDFLIPKMTWNILYKGGEGEFFGKWLLPENGFSWEIQNIEELTQYVPLGGPLLYLCNHTCHKDNVL